MNKKGWFTENVANILDLIMVMGTIILAFMVLMGVIPIDSASKEVIFYVFGALMAIVTGIYNYHRGSSQGSKDKTELMDMVNRNTDMEDFIKEEKFPDVQEKIEEKGDIIEKF